MELRFLKARAKEAYKPAIQEGPHYIITLVLLVIST